MSFPCIFRNAFDWFKCPRVYGVWLIFPLMPAGGHIPRSAASPMWNLPFHQLQEPSCCMAKSFSTLWASFKICCKFCSHLKPTVYNVDTFFLFKIEREKHGIHGKIERVEDKSYTVCLSLKTQERIGKIIFSITANASKLYWRHIFYFNTDLK